MLLVTVLAAVAVTVATTAVLVLVEPTAPRSEAVRTGALSGGAVVALYARFDLREARLDGGVSIQRTEFHGEVVLDRAAVATFLDINTTAPAGQLGTLLVGPQTRVDGNVDGWALTAP
jgi:hypothetical protein